MREGLVARHAHQVFLFSMVGASTTAPARVNVCDTIEGMVDTAGLTAVVGNEGLAHSWCATVLSSSFDCWFVSAPNHCERGSAKQC